VKTFRGIFVVPLLYGGMTLLAAPGAAEDNAGRMPALPGMVGKT